MSFYTSPLTHAKKVDTMAHGVVMETPSRSPCDVMKDMAADGRSTMGVLNERLSAYISDVRDLRTQALRSPSGYQESIKRLEVESVKLTSMYEGELTKLRLVCMLFL